jgi:hypothetical protein
MRWTRMAWAWALESGREDRLRRDPERSRLGGVDGGQT